MAFVNCSRTTEGIFKNRISFLWAPQVSHARRRAEAACLPVPSLFGGRTARVKTPHCCRGAAVWGRSLSLSLYLRSGRSHPNFRNLIFITSDMETIVWVLLMPRGPPPLRAVLETEGIVLGCLEKDK